MLGNSNLEREYFCADEAATRALGRALSVHLIVGDVVLLEGPLGAGKTTFVKGLLEGLGYEGPVRSPTFNLLQTFATIPPVLHADLYRLPNHQGLGIEDYLGTHLCLIEWPDRAVGLVQPESAWRVRLSFEGEGRSIAIEGPVRT